MNSDWEIFNANRINAVAGAADAQYYLGYCFLKGKNVAPDRKKAERWLRLSAAQGFKKARRALSDEFGYDEAALNALTEKLRAVIEKEDETIQGTKAEPQSDTARFADAPEANGVMMPAPQTVLTLEPIPPPESEILPVVELLPDPIEAEEKDEPSDSFGTVQKETEEKNERHIDERKLFDPAMPESMPCQETPDAKADSKGFTCLRDIRSRAEAGEAEAQFLMGECYYFGRNVDQNYEEALKWYRLAAESGSAEASCQIGNCYILGKGVPVDRNKAYLWFKSSAEDGYPGALYNLALCYRNGWGVQVDSDRETALYRRAAEGGNVRAQYDLGRAYYIGYGEQSFSEAARWLTMASEQGMAEASVLLARLYERGEGVEKNPEKAFGLLQSVADGGAREADAALAAFYLDGKFVPRDPPRAAALALPAAELGDTDAMKVMARYGELCGKLSEAFRWWSRAAESEDEEALCALGKCFFKGAGTPPNTVNAFKYLYAAARAGSFDAIPYLAECYKRGYGVEKNVSEGNRLLKWYKSHVARP